MARKPTARPPSEHLTTLARMLGQVEADTKMNVGRRKLVKKYLSGAMGEFQKEITK